MRSIGRLHVCNTRRIYLVCECVLKFKSNIYTRVQIINLNVFKKSDKAVTQLRNKDLKIGWKLSFSSVSIPLNG